MDWEAIKRYWIDHLNAHPMAAHHGLPQVKGADYRELCLAHKALRLGYEELTTENSALRAESAALRARCAALEGALGVVSDQHILAHRVPRECVENCLGCRILALLCPTAPPGAAERKDPT